MNDVMNDMGRDMDHDLDDFDDSLARALRRYVQLVGEALGLSGECSYVHADESASAYLALEDRLGRFPDRDVALLWDEKHGWSAAIETHSGEDLLVVAYLGQEVLPPPRVVANWTKNLFRMEPTPRHDTPPPRFPASDRLHRRLASYTGPVLAGTSAAGHG